MTKNSKINASVTVSNTGRFKGEEVVQLYLRDIVGSIARPMKELKGFEKIELDPGESKTVNFEIDNSLLEFYSYNNIWESEPGKFHLFIGTDSNVSDYKEFYLVEDQLKIPLNLLTEFPKMTIVYAKYGYGIKNDEMFKENKSILSIENGLEINKLI